MLPRTQSKESVCSSASTAKVFSVGDRVSVPGRSDGVVKFYGRTQFKDGVWVGVQLNEPKGKNNGSVDGIAYFECPQDYGLFIQPSKIVLKKAKSVISPVRSSPQGANASPSQSITGSIAPSVAASTSFKEHSPFAELYGFDIGEQVTTDGKSGKLKFLSSIDDKVYAGIILSKPEGNSDGTFKGVQYFKCFPKYGLFVEAEQVKKAQKQASLAQPKHSVQETRSSKLRNAALMSKNGGPSDMPATLRNSRDSLASNAFSIQVRSPHPKNVVSVMDAEIISSLKKCLQEKEGHLTHLAVELEEKRADIERLHFENEDLNRKIQYQEIEYQTKLDRLRDANESLVIEIQNEMDAKLKYQRMCIELEEKNGELSFCLTEAQVFLDEEKNKRNNSSVAISVAQATNERLSRLPAFTIVDVPPTRAQIPMNLDFSIETQTEENYSPNCLEKGFCAEAFSQTDYLNLSLAADSSVQTEALQTQDASVQSDPPAVIQFNHAEAQTQIFESTDASIQTSTPTPSLKTDVIENMTQTDILQTKDSDTMTTSSIFSNKVSQTQTDDDLTPSFNVTVIENMAQTDVLQMKDSSTMPLSSMFSNRISQTQTDVIPELLKPTFQSIDVQTDTPPNVETGVQASVTNVAKMAQTEAPTVSDHELQTTSTMNAQNKQSPTKPPPPQQILSPVNLISELRSKNARTYCEHCELFDSHETEECPKQEALRFERTKHHVYQSNGNIIPSKSQPRLYCDKCEAFGHSATDCPKAEAAAGN